MKEVLKIKIYQPDAHYRVPFSYQRRFTYPIPPFSTVKGFICNVMGIERGSRPTELLNHLNLSIFGKYECIVKEYIWFRNLEVKSHIQKFSSPINRYIDFSPQHPGGQMPVTIDVLHNVNLIIYVYHPSMLNEIEKAFKNLDKRAEILHLGRAEDWLVIEEVKKVKVEEDKVYFVPYFTWAPSPVYLYNSGKELYENYEKIFNEVQGNLFRLPTIYEIINGQRVFTDFVEVKLFEKPAVTFTFYVDKEENLPLFFTRLKVKENGNNTCKKKEN